MKYRDQQTSQRGLPRMGSENPSFPQSILTRTLVNARRPWLCLLLLLCATFVPSTRATDYSYVKVGNPAQTGGFANAMDNRGRVATTSLIRSYLFADNFFGNYVEITHVNVATSNPGLVAQGLNDAGDLVGRYRTNGAPANQTRGFIRRADGTIEPFDYPGVASTSISEINNLGHLVGETRSDLTAFGLIRGFVHTNGVSAEIHFPGAVLTRAYGINDAGDIVGHYQLEDAVNRPYLLRNGVYSQIVPLNPPGGLASGIAFSISDNGLVLGTYRDLANVSRTWVMRADFSFEYPVLPGTGRVINNAGQISGSYADVTNSNTTTPFVATPFAATGYLVPFSLPLAVGGALSGVSSLSPADLDGDGDLDVLAGAYGANRISWYSNLGGGAFGDEQVIDGAADSVWFSKAGDLDGDGDMDALGGMYSGTLAWYENSGSGAFSKHVLDTNNIGPWLEIADLDDDGRVDVLAAPDGGSDVILYRGLTNGFAAGTVLVSGFGGIGGVFVRDINGDGLRDLILGDYRNDMIVWYLNQGGGVLGPKQTMAAGDGGGVDRVIDLDGDGLLDIVSLEYVAEEVSWYRNQGGAAFGPRQVLPFNVSGPYAVTVDDYDADGDLDVAVATYSNAPDFYWSANQRNGVFGAPLLISKSLGQVSMLTSADFDGDGDKDIAAASFSGGQVFLFKNQRGSSANVVVPPADGKYLLGQYLDTTLYFGFPVVVSGTPQIDLQVGTQLITVDYLAGSGTPSLTFRYTITESDADADGVALVSSAVRLNGGTILDPYEGAANLSLTPETWRKVVVSGSAPFVASLQRSGATPTDADEVSFVITFNEPVDGFDTADLGIVASSAITGATVSEVSGSGAIYSVRVRTGSGSGTIGLTLLPEASLTDANGVALGSGFEGGEVFTLLRGPARTITTFYPSGHGDIAVGYESNRWNVVIDSDNFGVHDPQEVLIYGGAEGLSARGSSSQFDFLGVGAGQPLYVWPDNGAIPTLPELGVGGEGIPGGTAAAYFNSDPRVNASGPWVHVRLAGVRAPEGAHLSVYTVSPLGSPVVWWATSDGISSKDTLAILEGSHQHFNFAFTKPGIYEADIIVSGYRDANGNGVYESGKDPYIESGVETIYFAIDLPSGMQPYIVPPGMSGRRPMPAFTFETVDIDGGTETLLSDIRNDGTLVGRYKDSSGISQGFIQEGSQRTVFNVTGTTATFPGGIDSFGRVAGFYRNATNPEIQHGFIRETNGAITTIDGPDQTFTYAWRINDAGQVNGYWFEDPFFIRSFRRATNGTLTTNLFVGSPVGTVTRGMNEAGDMTGWKWNESFTLQGVIFAGDMTNVFTVAGWEHTLPGDINNLGEIAGTVNNGFTNTAGFFRRANGDTVVFSPPGAVEVEVFGLNDLGQVVGEYADAGGSRLGFIARPAVKLSSGHTDIGIAFEEGAFDLHIHDEETDTEYAPGGAVLCVGEPAEQPIPDTAAFSFLGQPGYSTWVLPAVEDERLLFLGFAAEEIEAGVFVGDMLRMELVSVQGAGDFAVYSVDGFGNPVVHMNSADGIRAADFFQVFAGGHTDLNWAFSAPGTYRIGFQVRGRLVAGNQEVQSDVVYYTFTVPAPRLSQPPQPDDSFVYKVIDLGTFGGTEFNTAIDVNNAGVVVGGSSLSNNIDHPIFLWEDGHLKNLGLFGGRTAGADAISETGWIVGTTTTPAGDFEPYVPYRLGTNLLFEPIPLILGAQNGSAQDVDDNGTTVGTLDLPDSSMRAFLSFTNAPTIDLGTFGGSSSGAEGINNSGVIVGWAQLSNGETRAFRHVGTGPLNVATDDLGTLGGNNSRAFAVSEAGKVVGRSRTTSGVQHAFLWEQGAGMIDLGSLGGDNTYAFGISTNDVVTGWGNLVPGGDPTHGWVWTSATGMRDLNTLIPFGTGLEVTVAYGVNEPGWIAGGATRLSDGSSRSVLLKPATRLKRGHTDIGLVFEGGAFAFEVHAEDTDTEYSPDAAVLNLPPLTQRVVPTNTAFAFLGPVGTPVWVLPGVENPKLLFLGLAAEEIEKGLFVNDELRFTLKGVEGPGHFALYSIDGFGVPQVHMNSGDGITAADVKSILARSHEDFNWSFTAPGLYRVKFQASGTLVAGSRLIESREVEYCFEVIGIESRLAIARSGGNVTISFVTQDGLTYHLESAPAVTGPWTDEGAAFLGTGRLKEISVPAGGGRAFFRVNAGVRD
ncbi:MAG: choice-of-anchor M domain-containing protein [Verrucomicrobiales bacterium]|nr:choice-of-anchor M domain-containing protein [Verrucomicrobiales bacterium]